jgi:hypothetical protein
VKPAPTSAETIDPTFVPELPPSAVSVEVDGETVIYEETLSSVHVLDRVGTVLWTLFDGRASLSELSVLLAEAYEVDVGTIERDVVRFTRDMGRRGLLHGIEPDPDVVEAHRTDGAVSPEADDCGD